MSDITLYVKTGCPFCAKVTAVLNAYKIPFIEKNISEDGNLDELISLGGKPQTPFMVDGDTMMYESESIIHHLEKKHVPEGAPRRPKVHFARGTEVCPSE